MVITSPPIQSWTDDMLRVIRPGLSFFETGKGPQGPNQIDWKGEEVSCGNVKGKLKCNNGHEVYMTSYCYRQECPVCWHQWLARQLKAVKRRFGWVRTTLGGATRHVVVSIKSRPRSKSEYIKSRKWARELVKKAGVRGGLLVGHAHVRSDGSEGVHFHFITIGGIDYDNLPKGWGTRWEGDKRVIFTNNADNDIIKDIRGVGLAKSLINYELDHAIKLDGVHTVSWFGVFHSAYVAVTKEEISNHRRCLYRGPDGRCCGRRMFEDRTIQHFDGGSTKNPPAKEIIIEYHFNWRRKPII